MGLKNAKGFTSKLLDISMSYSCKTIVILYFTSPFTFVNFYIQKLTFHIAFVKDNPKTVREENVYINELSS